VLFHNQLLNASAGLNRLVFAMGPTKKPRLMIEKGPQNVRALLIFPERTRIQAGIGTCIKIEISTGCRGFNGPVPQPLCMRFVASTNADKLGETVVPVN
jgi:hypothetical protein